MKTTIAAMFAVSVLATGCGLAAGGAAEEATPPTGDGMAMCAPGVTDCVDVVDDSGDAGDAAGTRPSDDTLREEARSMLGLAEDELAEDVRIGRRGGEQMMLTEDYQVGRFTVELDDDGTGTFRVTAVTAELGDAPETFTTAT
ncbi:MAG: hypothetical protein KY461_07670 [Actinobacteria bacterium]|nr:hypothetical protein [Actinomycetota bacterium]